MNAIVTGASQGLGKEIAQYFLTKGANVAICARDAAMLEVARADLSKIGPRVVAQPCDVSSEIQVDDFVSFAEKQLGSIDTLVNNAGVYGPMGKTEEVDFEAWKRALEINLYGVLLPCRALIPKFKTVKRGKIVVLSGGGATAPLPFVSSYAASKAAVVRLVETLAEELRDYHIDINAVAPGALNTRLLDEALAAGPGKLGVGFYQKMIQQKENGGVPLAKGAALCWYLASSESDGITGKLLSAQWDPWATLQEHESDLKSDIYTLRRIVPKDRGKGLGRVKSTNPGFAIVGCGLIGKKRAASLPQGSLRVACDLNLSLAQALSPRAVTHVEDALTDDVDAVVIATLNATLAPIATQAIQAGKHVLIEKPAGVSAAEIAALESLAAEKQVCVRVGYNHRFHPAFQKARQIVDSGLLGPLMFIRGRYGHGGRVGYDREWRANPSLSGGGELIDQGVHLIDLAAWFLGDFTSISGHADTLFWDMPVDDNAFLDLRTAKGQTAWLQVSCSEWKNLFSFEIYGRNAKLHIEGLGGSYGVERLAHYQMKPEMGPPDTTIYEFPGADTSWALEMTEFCRDIELERTPEPGLREARHALAVVEKIYHH